jgi:hypothetical protein
MSDDKTYTVLDKNGQEMRIKGQYLMQHLEDQSEKDLWLQVAKQYLVDAHIIEYEIASLAKMELERRAFKETKRLAKTTTFYSGILGISGTLIGALLGYYVGNG